MSVTEKMLYYIEDAAEELAELIEIEEGKMREAQSKQEEVREIKEELRDDEVTLEGQEEELWAKQDHFEEAVEKTEENEYFETVREFEKQEKALADKRDKLEAKKQAAANEHSHAKRDEHRARTSLMAYKTALRIVLLEKACREARQAQPQPDPDQYLMHRRINPSPY